MAENSTNGVKRKRGADSKFYAVRVGKSPGIYYSWTDCLSQVKGVKGALFKSFTSLTEAEQYLNGKASTSKSSSSKFYAVVSGRKPGIYTDWNAALEQITGWTKPLHRSFTTRTEAEAFLRANVNKPPSTPTKPKPGNSSDDPHAATANGDDAEPPAKLAKTTNGPVNHNLPNGTSDSATTSDLQDPGWDPLPADAEDGFDPRITIDQTSGNLRYKTPAESSRLKPTARVNPTTDVLNIYTDGACRGNGQDGAIAGVGVYFGPRDPRNVSEAVPGPRQTNQRAELLALSRALDITPLTRPAMIYSDSKYAIHCVTEWFVKWERNGWVGSSGKGVENRDLVEKVVGRIREREAAGASTRFTWVKGHAAEEGNVAADRLAVEGALGRGISVVSGKGEGAAEGDGVAVGVHGE